MWTWSTKIPVVVTKTVEIWLPLVSEEVCGHLVEVWLRNLFYTRFLKTRMLSLSDGGDVTVGKCFFYTLSIRWTWKSSKQPYGIQPQDINKMAPLLTQLGGQSSLWETTTLYGSPVIICLPNMYVEIGETRVKILHYRATVRNKAECQQKWSAMCVWAGIRHIKEGYLKHFLAFKGCMWAAVPTMQP